MFFSRNEFGKSDQKVLIPMICFVPTSKPKERSNNSIDWIRHRPLKSTVTRGSSKDRNDIEILQHKRSRPYRCENCPYFFHEVKFYALGAVV